MNLFSILSDFFKSESTSSEPAEQVDTRDKWRLLVGQIFLGEFVFVSFETPWITADFTPSEDFSRFIPYFEWEKRIDARLDDETEAEEPKGELAALIDEVHSLGRMQVVDLKTNESWVPMLHFGEDYSYATFR